ncbi:MFS transporter [Brachybacterium sp. AOP43-C2-M15]|uniref:MFS transporter n=1 Tax=Brachybacterium sp. AOP43-C2-M15 TaxID=3457661 RepID=UPI0040345C75
MATDTDQSPVPDHAIARRIHPAILAGIVGLFPFTIYSTFVVPIARTADEDVASIGALRGTGGVAAVLVGVAIAPMMTRIPPRWSSAASLALLAATCILGSLGTLPALVAFCLGIGAATAVLTPALLSSATAGFRLPADSARAATLVTATQSLAAVLAGPVIGLMSLWRGWQGTLWITAALAVAIALLTLRSPPGRVDAPSAAVRQSGYLDAFGRVARRPHLLALISMAGLRTASFMGYLAFLAVHFQRAFSIDAAAFTLVWSVSGASFFVGNFLAGRWARRTISAPGAARALILGGLVLALASVLLVFTTTLLPLALAATVAMGFGHAVIAAQITTLIAHRAGDQAGTVFSLNGSAMSLGVFVGAALGGLGLQLAGMAGTGLALALPMVIALVLLPIAVPRTDRRTAPRQGHST